MSLEDILKQINKTSSNKIIKNKWYPIHDFYRNLDVIHQILTILLWQSVNEQIEHNKRERNQKGPKRNRVPLTLQFWMDKHFETQQ